MGGAAAEIACRVIIVDTSVWIDHFRRPEPRLLELVASDTLLIHPVIVGEIAAGSIANRARRLLELDSLPQAERASDFITRHLIEAHRLHGLELNYIDLQILASTRLTPLARLWTRDKALARAASRLHVGVDD